MKSLRLTGIATHDFYQVTVQDIREWRYANPGASERMWQAGDIVGWQKGEKHCLNTTEPEILAKTIAEARACAERLSYELTKRTEVQRHRYATGKDLSEISQSQAQTKEVQANKEESRPKKVLPDKIPNNWEDRKKRAKLAVKSGISRT